MGSNTAEKLAVDDTRSDALDVTTDEEAVVDSASAVVTHHHWILGYPSVESTLVIVPPPAASSSTETEGDTSADEAPAVEGSDTLAAFSAIFSV